MPIPVSLPLERCLYFLPFLRHYHFLYTISIGDRKWHCSIENIQLLLMYYCNYIWVYLVLCPRYCKMLVENSDFFPTPQPLQAPSRVTPLQFPNAARAQKLKRWCYQQHDSFWSHTSTRHVPVLVSTVATGY